MSCPALCGLIDRQPLQCICNQPQALLSHWTDCPNLWIVRLCGARGLDALLRAELQSTIDQQLPETPIRQKLTDLLLGRLLPQVLDL